MQKIVRRAGEERLNRPNVPALNLLIFWRWSVANCRRAADLILFMMLIGAITPKPRPPKLTDAACEEMRARQRYLYSITLSAG
jgi:hypothetical protein